MYSFPCLRTNKTVTSLDSSKAILTYAIFIFTNNFLYCVYLTKRHPITRPLDSRPADQPTERRLFKVSAFFIFNIEVELCLALFMAPCVQSCHCFNIWFTSALWCHSAAAVGCCHFRSKLRSTHKIFIFHLCEWHNDPQNKIKKLKLNGMKNVKENNSGCESNACIYRHD